MHNTSAYTAEREKLHASSSPPQHKLNSLEFDKVLEHNPDELGVELCDTIDSVRADDSNVGHSDLLRRSLCVIGEASTDDVSWVAQRADRSSWCSP